MKYTREAFSTMVDELFNLTQEHLRQDGFIVETLMGFNSAGKNVATFISAGGMDVERLSMLTPDVTKVVHRPLLSSGSLLAAGFALHGVSCAAYAGCVLLPEEQEQYVVTVGAWPQEVFSRAHALPCDLVTSSRTEVETLGLETLQFGQLQEDLVLLENWIVGLVPDV